MSSLHSGDPFDGQVLRRLRRDHYARQPAQASHAAPRTRDTGLHASGKSGEAGLLAELRRKRDTPE